MPDVYAFKENGKISNFSVYGMPGVFEETATEE